MLIYEKTTDGVRHLYGTEGNIPSVSDEQLAYKDNAGTTVDVSGMKYFYNKNGAIYGNASTSQLPTDLDKKINVWLDDDKHLHIQVKDKLYKVTLYEVPILAVVSEFPH